MKRYLVSLSLVACLQGTLFGGQEAAQESGAVYWGKLAFHVVIAALTAKKGAEAASDSWYQAERAARSSWNQAERAARSSWYQTEKAARLTEKVAGLLWNQEEKAQRLAEKAAGLAEKAAGLAEKAGIDPRYQAKIKKVDELSLSLSQDINFFKDYGCFVINTSMLHDFRMRSAEIVDFWSQKESYKNLIEISSYSLFFFITLDTLRRKSKSGWVLPDKLSPYYWLSPYMPESFEVNLFGVRFF